MQMRREKNSCRFHVELLMKLNAIQSLYIYVNRHSTIDIIIIFVIRVHHLVA